MDMCPVGSRGFYTCVDFRPWGIYECTVLLTAKRYDELNEEYRSAIVFENSRLSQTLSPGEGWWKLRFLKWFSSCRFPQLMQDSILLFPLLIQERQKAGRKTGGKKTHTVESGRGERGLGFHWVDWRGFSPLNRSTCSSGISRRQSSILVEWGCLPITPWVPNGCLSMKEIPVVLIWACGVWELAMWGWYQDIAGADARTNWGKLFPPSANATKMPPSKTLDQWLTAEVLFTPDANLYVTLLVQHA